MTAGRVGRVGAGARGNDRPRLTPPSHRSHTPGLHHEERAVNGTSTRRASAERPGGWWKPGRRRRRMDPGASGPNGDAASAAEPSRLRRRAPAIQGSADRPRQRPVGHGVRHRRMRVAPRKARPFVPGRSGRFLIHGRGRAARRPPT